MAGVLVVPAIPSGAAGGGAGSGGAGISRADYWQDLAPQLGRYQRFTVSSQSPSSERSRVVILDELVDAERAPDDFGSGYLYVMDGDQRGVQRRVLSQGDEAPIGALVLSRSFVAALAPGTTVAYTDPCPVVDYGGMKGLVTFCVEALKRLRVDVRIAMMGDGTRRVSLNAWPWITSIDWTDGVYDTRGITASNPLRRSSREYDVTVNGADVTLELSLTYGPDVEYELKAFAPADQVLSDGATWGYSVGGLVSDTTRAAAPVRHVTTLAMDKALEWLIDRTLDDDSLTEAKRARVAQRYSRQLPTWQAAAQYVLLHNQPQRVAELPRQIVSTRQRGARSWPY